MINIHVSVSSLGGRRHRNFFHTLALQEIFIANFVLVFSFNYTFYMFFFMIKV